MTLTQALHKHNQTTKLLTTYAELQEVWLLPLRTQAQAQKWETGYR